MRVTDLNEGTEVDVSDPRIKAGVLLAPPGRVKISPHVRPSTTRSCETTVSLGLRGCASRRVAYVTRDSNLAS